MCVCVCVCVCDLTGDLLSGLVGRLRVCVCVCVCDLTGDLLSGLVGRLRVCVCVCVCVCVRVTDQPPVMLFFVFRCERLNQNRP